MAMNTGLEAQASESHEGLRVLHYSTWKTACGIAGYAGDLVEALSRLGTRNTVRPIDRGLLKQLSSSETRLEMAALCEQARQYDIVHIQHEFSFFTGSESLWESNQNLMWALRQLRRQGTPAVITFHTEPQFLQEHVGPRARLVHLLNGRFPWHGWTLGKVIQRRPSRFRTIVHTRRARASLVNCGVPPEVVEVIPIGFPPSRTSQCTLDSRTAKERLGLPADCTLLSLFGFVASYKGHEVAVRALKALPESYCLAVVGGPHPQGKERTLNNILRLWKKEDPRRLLITGFVGQEELDLYHAATDICLAPYIDDSLSSSAAITWALTSGKPVIASNIQAFREVNEQSECLLMVTPKAELELAWQIQRLAGSRALQQRLVENARRVTRENSWPEIARRVQALYASMLESSSCLYRPRPLCQGSLKEQRAQWQQKQTCAAPSPANAQHVSA